MIRNLILVPAPRNSSTHAIPNKLTIHQFMGLNDLSRSAKDTVSTMHKDKKASIKRIKTMIIEDGTHFILFSTRFNFIAHLVTQELWIQIHQIFQLVHNNYQDPFGGVAILEVIDPYLIKEGKIDILGF